MPEAPSSSEMTPWMSPPSQLRHDIVDVSPIPAQRWHRGCPPTIYFWLLASISFVSFGPSHPSASPHGPLEEVAAREGAFPRSQWESCFISSLIPGKDSDFSTNVAEDINRKRKIRTSFPISLPALLSYLPCQHPPTAQQSSLCILLLGICFIAKVDLLSRKYGEHMEWLSVLRFLFGFLFFLFPETLCPPHS